MPGRQVRRKMREADRVSKGKDRPEKQSEKRQQQIQSNPASETEWVILAAAIKRKTSLGGTPR